MKIVFFGSDDFAATHLTALLNAKLNVVACVTGPDKPKGRGMLMDISPIKAIALEHQLPYLQPATLKDDSVVEALRAYDADFFVVVAYGRLLTQAVLDLPKIFAINVHGSLLPKYRGAAPIHWAIINGERETGVTVQKMALALDSGDIISQLILPITPITTTVQLREQMAKAGAELLVNTIAGIKDGNYQLKPQDESAVTYASKLTKEMGRIDWQLTAIDIDRLIRGLTPWPGVFTYINGKMLKIHQASIIEEVLKPGEIGTINKEGIAVGCQRGALRLTLVQPQAGRIMPAYDFAQGHHLNSGSKLG